MTLAVTLTNLLYEEYRVMSIAAAGTLVTVAFVAIATLILSGSSSPLNVCSTGHSETGYLRNSRPFCHALSGPISLGFFPRVIQSAMLKSPFVQYQSAGIVPSWISPMRVAAKVLKP